VQIASTTTPDITNHIATRWTAFEYLGLTYNIPAPTDIPTNTLPDNKTAWGQITSSVPDQTPPIYVTIAVIVVCSVVGIMASVKLVCALLALCR
jgi:hypothetical protein